MSTPAAPIEIIVTRHAEKRARERLGLKRSAVRRTVQRAWEKGWLSRGSRLLARMGPEARVHKVWGDHVYVFARNGDGSWCLVTITPGRTRGLVESDEAEPKRERLRRQGRRLSWRK